MPVVSRFLVIAAVSTVAVVATVDSAPANAAFLEAGIQAGVIDRTLAGTGYRTGFNFQIHADLALIPPILMIGAYANGFPFGGKLAPEQQGSSNTSIDFRTFGARAKLRIPIPGAVTPYAIAGAGWVRGDFPDQTLTLCGTVQGVSGCTNRTVPSATANFVEFVLGAGAMIKLAGPLHLSLEGAWRPTIGYENDDYEKTLRSGSTTAPPPSRNGSAYSFHGGLALSF
jgi:opacity protein-like surface antigen